MLTTFRSDKGREFLLKSSHSLVPLVRHFKEFSRVSHSAPAISQRPCSSPAGSPPSVPAACLNSDDLPSPLVSARFSGHRTISTIQIRLDPPETLPSPCARLCAEREVASTPPPIVSVILAFQIETLHFL